MFRRTDLKTYAHVCVPIVNVNSVCLTHLHTDDHSCVELSLIDDKEGTDYINASWIDVSTDLIIPLVNFNDAMYFSEFQKDKSIHCFTR